MQLSKRLFERNESFLSNFFDYNVKKCMLELSSNLMKCSPTAVCCHGTNKVVDHVALPHVNRFEANHRVFNRTEYKYSQIGL